MTKNQFIGLILVYIILTIVSLVLSIFIKYSDAPLIVSLSSIGICSIILISKSKSEIETDDEDEKK